MPELSQAEVKSKDFSLFGLRGLEGNIIDSQRNIEVDANYP
jgi:hypothetical protein